MTVTSPPDDTGTVPNLSAPERPLGPGDTVDRYRIEHMIAAGGMARVYRATHVFTGRTVALKVMRTRYLRRPDLVERFQKEAMALSQIRHSNVVMIENGGLTEKGEVFIAMEFLEGRTLRDVLVERGRLSIREALSILCQIALGVAAAHEVNVVHRDLKPENIFCTSDGSVKVLDLGLAKFIGYDLKETDPASNAMIGTAAYIAPERLDGLPIDARCDIYALGLIAYECLAGFHPLVPDGIWPSSEEIALRQLTFDPPALRQLPPDLWAAIARAMHKDRERRFATMDELSAVLHGIRHDLGASASTSSAGARPSAPGAPGPISNRLAASARSLDGHVVSRAPQRSSTHSKARSVRGPAAASAPRRILDAILRYPMVAGAVIGLIGAFALFFWQRSHRAPRGPAADSNPRVVAFSSGVATPIASSAVQGASAIASSPQIPSPLVSSTPALSMARPSTPVIPAVSPTPATSAVAAAPATAPSTPAVTPAPSTSAPTRRAAVPSASMSASAVAQRPPASTSTARRPLGLPKSGL